MALASAPLRLAEVTSAVAIATDLGAALAPETSLRACLIPTELARACDFAEDELADVYTPPCSAWRAVAGRCARRSRWAAFWYAGLSSTAPS